MPIKTGEILSHIAEVLMTKANGELSPMRQSFDKAVDRENLSTDQMETVEKYLSATAKNMNKTGHSLLWHLFKDGIGKCASSVTGNGTVSKTATLDFIVFSKWTVQNYRMMMNLPEHQTAPTIFSRAASVSDFDIFLSYLEKTILPAVKKSYCEEHRLKPKELDLEIFAREQELLETNIPGSEIIKPIPRDEWMKTKSPDSRL